MEGNMNAIFPLEENKILINIQNNSNCVRKLANNTYIGKVQLIKACPSMTRPGCTVSLVNKQNNINESNSNVNIELIDEILKQVDNTDNLSDLKTLLLNNINVFSQNEYDIGTIKDYYHRIDLYDDKPVACKPYRTPHSKCEVIDQEIMRLMKAGVIKESKSPYAAPCLLVYKKDKSPRLVVDFRKLNQKVIPVQYPIPHLETALQLLSGNEVYSSIDLISAFHQINVLPEDTHKLGFYTSRGHYEYLKCPMGLVTSSAAMQSIIERVLSGLNNKICLVYIDDIIIWGDNVKTHDKNLATVLNRLAEFGFKIKLKKCLFRKHKIECLGHLITKDGIRPIQSRTDSLINKPIPKTLKQLRSFLGFTGYYRRFVPHFAQIAKPLTELTKKDKKFIWTDLCQNSYDKLIQHIINAPILVAPDFSKPFYVTTDASIEGLGGILSQVYNGVHHPIAFYSRTLNNAEMKYPIYDLEGLAIKVCLQKWKFFLLGYKTIVRTDNKPVMALLKNNQCEGRIGKYLASIMEFNVTYEHIPGKENILADYLSRYVKSVKLLPNDINTFNILDNDQLINLQSNEDYINKALNDPKLKYKFVSINNIIYYKSHDNIYKLCIPKSVTNNYIKYFHNHLGMHEGIHRTIERIKKYIYWPNMVSDIQQCVKNCHICQCAKPSHKRKNILGNFPTPSKCFDRLHLDIIGPFPLTRNKYKYLLVIVDAFSHYCSITPLRQKNANAVCLAVDNLISKFGTPSIIVSDQGKENTAQIFQDYCRNHNIENYLITPYHHASNGMVERFNLQIENALRCSLLENKGSWDHYINSIQDSLNSTIHGSTGLTPYEIINNKTACINLPGFIPNNNYIKPTNDELLYTVKSNLLNSKNKMFAKHNLHRINRNFNINDKVYVKCNVPHNKLKPLYDGPYKIISVNDSKFSYNILNDTTGAITTHHINQIKYVFGAKLYNI